MWRSLFLIALLSVFVGCAATQMSRNAPPLHSDCQLSPTDRAWVDRAVEAWRMAAPDIAGIGELENFPAVIFSDTCTLTSSNALTLTNADAAWSAQAHNGEILLPDGEAMPAGVTSFTNANEHGAYFVMSTPSVWESGGVAGGPLGLETLMVAVLLHEGSHVVQAPTYGLRVVALQERHSLPDSFGDDSLQKYFESQEDFTASITRETALFFQAADAADRATAKGLARHARDLMLVRANRWYAGDEFYWREAEDIWLTFEGAGQWLGYQWLIHARGGAVPTSQAMSGFGQRSRWWSQNEGLAIALTLDRLAGPDWRRHAFGDGSKSLLEMLDESLDQ